jgi:ATP-dependent DNA helicase RecQ
MPETIATLAQRVLGLTELRAGIAEAAQALVDGRDVIAVMPTGYGKSAVYQLAGTYLDGITIVVSPLIALQKDQVRALEQMKQAPEAVAINSSASAKTVARAWEGLADGEPHFVFLTPEQLASEENLARLSALPVRLIAVDEAHCVSTWGHDFRPDYLALGDVIERLGHPPVAALTATGAPPVRADITDRLRLRDPLIAARGFDRPALRLKVSRHESDREKREAVVEHVSQLTRPGLLYVATRRDTSRYANELDATGLRTAAYHGGMAAGERGRVHEAFHRDEVDVVVATSAFGMGIDKANVRYVVHAAVPGSLDEYYQEVGRAGRDGQPAVAALHYRPEDFALSSFFNAGAPDEAELVRVFGAVSAAGGIGRTELAENLGMNRRTLARLLATLADAGTIEVRKRRLHARGGITPADAARRALETVQARQRVEESRIDMMRAYAETLGCRRQHLLGYFGEDLPEPCGNCDNCLSGSAYEQSEERAENAAESETIGDDEPFPPHSVVMHREWGEGEVMSCEPDRITVFFEAQGYKVLSREAIAETGVLRRA